eukprot:1153194-Pelagomonas_calceolata.AAC.9
MLCKSWSSAGSRCSSWRQAVRGVTLFCPGGRQRVTLKCGGSVWPYKQSMAEGRQRPPVLVLVCLELLFNSAVSGYQFTRQSMTSTEDMQAPGSSRHTDQLFKVSSSRRKGIHFKNIFWLLEEKMRPCKPEGCGRRKGYRQAEGVLWTIRRLKIRISSGYTAGIKQL